MPPDRARRSEAVIQMFDWRFKHVARAIPGLAALGYSDLHVSPPQHSHEAAWPWWGRYQPTGYGIGGPLGSAEAFAAMTATARAHGMRVIADVVLRNPCGAAGTLCGVSIDDRAAAFAAGLDYLRRLLALGAGGLRFDAAGSVPPAFFAWALPRLGPVPAFGEVVSEQVRDLRPYLDVPGLRMLDFPLLATLRRAFAPGGDLRLLRDPAAAGRALPTARAIGFVRNHDIERGQAGDKGIDNPAYRARFGVGWNEIARRLDRRAVDLAHAWLFARDGGVPYVLAAMRTLPEAARLDRAEDTVIAAGLRFRALCRAGGDPAETWCLARPDAVAFQRGETMFAVLNAAATPLSLAGLRTSLRPGFYRDLIGGLLLRVLEHGQIGAADALPGRSAALYARSAAAVDARAAA